MHHRKIVTVPASTPVLKSSNCDSHHAQENEDDEYNDNHEPDVVAVHSDTSIKVVVVASARV
jgi:hypothetical protein